MLPSVFAILRRPAWRVGVALAALAALAALIAWWSLRGDGRGGDADVPPLLRFEESGLLYTYHVPTASEALFDVAADPRLLRNLVRDRPADARRLREHLEQQIREKTGVESIEDLRRAHADLIERLRSLGYF